jgi:cell division protease FtsH
MIDLEVKAIIQACETRARQMITDNMDKFERIALNLIERETLNGEEIDILMRGEDLPPMQLPSVAKAPREGKEGKKAGSVAEDGGEQILEPAKT